MVRTLKDAPTRAFCCKHIDERCWYVVDSLTVYNYAKQLKAFKWKTPLEMLTRSMSRAEQFRAAPDSFISGPYTQAPGPRPKRPLATRTSAKRADEPCLLARMKRIEG